MADMLVRNLDDAILARLKERARRNGRSLQSEAKLLLEQAAGADEIEQMLLGWQNRFKAKRLGKSSSLIREDRAR
jgi:plasmid stability protein